MNFKDHYAFVTGWTGVTVLDIAQPASPQLVAELPLPHFENEDVDLCGNTLIVVNDREAKDLGSVLYVVSIANPLAPSVEAVLPLGLTGNGRGSGHIANFVKSDCTQAWIDGGDHVEVVDLTDPAAPRSLGKFESAASMSDAFKVSHDTELDSSGRCGTSAAAARPRTRSRRTRSPRSCSGTTGAAGTNPSPYNDFILHNSQHRGKTLLVTEEDYIDTDETPPGGCRGQGKFETWDASHAQQERDHAAGHVADRAQRHVHRAARWTPRRRSPSTAPRTGSTPAGVAAVGWYEQGVRFLDYRTPTDIKQVGYYIPANGSTWAAYWSPTDPTGQIVYTADAYRGVDVLEDRRRWADGQEGRRAGPGVVVRQPVAGLGRVPAAPGVRVRLPGPAAGGRRTDLARCARGSAFGREAAVREQSDPRIRISDQPHVQGPLGL